MSLSDLHTFHIPVMGLGYTIDTPVKVGRFGISSVISIIEDNVIERMRRFYCEKENEPYRFIDENNDDHRALRITAYLNLLNKILRNQVEKGGRAHARGACVQRPRAAGADRHARRTQQPAGFYRARRG
mgnify:CR=1 FL=1